MLILTSGDFICKTYGDLEIKRMLSFYTKKECLAPCVDKMLNIGIKRPPLGILSRHSDQI